MKKNNEEKFALYGYTPKMSFIKGCEYYRQALKEFIEEIQDDEDLTDGETLDLIYKFVNESNKDLNVVVCSDEQIAAMKKEIATR